jgi:ankyrin repeat protein
MKKRIRISLLIFLFCIGYASVSLAADGELPQFVDAVIAGDVDLANILTIAVRNNVSNDLIELLLKKGININTASYFEKEKKTYQTYPLSMAVIREEFNLVKMFLDYGADVELEDSIDVSPMHYAVESGIDYIDLLVEYGGDINTGTIGRPISLAVGRNNIKAVKHLIDLGADLKFTGQYNPLLLSVTYRNYGIAEVLLKAGANDGRDEYMQRAIEIRDRKMVKLLTDNGLQLLESHIINLILYADFDLFSFIFDTYDIPISEKYLAALANTFICNEDAGLKMYKYLSDRNKVSLKTPIGGKNFEYLVLVLDYTNCIEILDGKIELVKKVFTKTDREKIIMKLKGLSGE